MKNFKTLFLALLLPVAGCELIFPESGEQGRIEVNFDEAMFIQTRAQTAVLDTNLFILTVTDSKGKQIYKGDYGSAPEQMMVTPGTYTVCALSSELTAPKFSAPQYGDSQQATVTAGKTSRVKLICRQMNAGIKLEINPAFLTAYPSGVLFLKSSEGRLMYSYSEKRIAYFKPGNVSLILNEGVSEQTLFTRSLAPQEILSVRIDVKESASQSQGNTAAALSIQIDTSRIWINEQYVIGASADKGSEKDNAIGVPQARDMVGAEGVWVGGYIVGGDLTSTNCSFSAPFSSATNLVLASKSSVKTRSSCLSVQLPKGAIRDALNLADHPENLGRHVLIKGNIVEAYYGLPGLQNVTEFELR